MTEEPAPDRAINVACPEESVVDLADEMDADDPSIRLTHVDPATEPLDTDCLVVTDPSAVAGDQPLPTVLYTRADPMNICRETLTTVDTIVQRDRSDSADRLFEKIRTLCGGGLSRQVPADSPALAPPIVAVLVAPDGTVEWSSHDLETLFTERPADAPDSVYEWLIHSVAVSSPSIAAVLDDDPADRTGGLVTVPAAEKYRQYRHDSYRLPDGNRLELFENVTDELAQFDRLEQVTALVEHTRDGLFALDADGAIRLCNPSLAASVGYDRSAIEGAHVSALIVDSAYPMVRERMQSGLAAGRDSIVVQTELQTVDDEALEAEISLSIRRENGQYAGALGVVRPVSDRQRRRQELRRYGRIVEAVGSPICTLDEDGQLRYVNRQFREQFGEETLELLGEPLAKLLDTQAATRFETALAGVLDGDGATESFEIEITPGDGTPVPTECRLGLLPPTADDTDAVVVVFHDITRLKRREQRLSKFASVVSHDLRNPMDVALGRAEMLPEIADLDPQTERHLSDISSSLKRMDRLIRNVLTLTRGRGEPVETEPVDLAAVAESAWANVSTDRSDLHVETDREIRAHPDRLLRLFENLFRNAVQHAGPAVTVRVETTTAGFLVADDGPGVPEHHRGQIFEDGFTTAGEGTGLGLAIVREIARAHGWEVTLADGPGARFEFRGVDATSEGDG